MLKSGRRRRFTRSELPALFKWSSIMTAEIIKMFPTLPSIERMDRSKSLDSGDHVDDNVTGDISRECRCCLVVAATSDMELLYKNASKSTSDALKLVVRLYRLVVRLLLATARTLNPLSSLKLAMVSLSLNSLFARLALFCNPQQNCTLPFTKSFSHGTATIPLLSQNSIGSNCPFHSPFALSLCHLAASSQVTAGPLDKVD